MRTNCAVMNILFVLVSMVRTVIFRELHKMLSGLLKEDLVQNKASADISWHQHWKVLMYRAVSTFYDQSPDQM